MNNESIMYTIFLFSKTNSHVAIKDQAAMTSSQLPAQIQDKPSNSTQPPVLEDRQNKNLPVLQ